MLQNDIIKEAMIRCGQVLDMMTKQHASITVSLLLRLPLNVRSPETGCPSQVRSLASEEEDGVLLTEQPGRYSVVFDPLDGSRNIDAAIPTGTIFGVYLCQTVPEDVMDENEWQVAFMVSVNAMCCPQIYQVLRGVHSASHMACYGRALSDCLQSGDQLGDLAHATSPSTTCKFYSRAFVGSPVPNGCVSAQWLLDMLCIHQQPCWF